MSAVDFTEWAAPDLELTFGGRTFVVRPPSVDDAAKLLALAVRGEVNLGIAPQGVTVPEPILEVLASIGPDEHPALGSTFMEMREAGLSAATIDRAAYYAIFYWARGKRYADALATLLWAPRASDDGSEPGDVAADGGGRPKG